MIYKIPPQAASDFRQHLTNSLNQITDEKIKKRFLEVQFEYFYDKTYQYVNAFSDIIGGAHENRREINLSGIGDVSLTALLTELDLKTKWAVGSCHLMIRKFFESNVSDTPL